MTLSNFNRLSKNSRIGISVDSDSLEDKDNSEPIRYYAEFEIKRLTKASSFIANMETMYIAKKDYKGKASRIYHIYRVRDKRLITSVPKEKEEAIRLVQRKYKG